MVLLSERQELNASLQAINWLWIWDREEEPQAKIMMARGKNWAQVSLSDGLSPKSGRYPVTERSLRFYLSRHAQLLLVKLVERSFPFEMLAFYVLTATDIDSNTRRLLESFQKWFSRSR